MAVRTDAEFLVPLKLKDEISKALKKTAEQAKETTQEFTALERATIVWNQAIELAGKAYGFVSGTMDHLVESYADAEKAELKLANAMRRSGSYSTAAMTSFKEFADNLQNTSEVEGDAAIAMLANAKAMKFSDDVAKRLVQTSADLAAVTEGDVGGAYEALKKSMKGSGMAIGRMFPELKGLTDEQHKQGAALKYLEERYKGFAEAAGKTMAGLRKQREHALGDLQEEIGGLLVDVFNLPASTARQRDMFLAMKDAIAEVKPKLLDIRDTLSSVGAGIKGAFTAVDWGALAKDIGLLAGAMALAGAAFTVMNMNAMGLAVAMGVIGSKVTAVAAAFKSTVGLWGLFAAQAVVVALQVAFVAAALTTVAVATEIVIRNMTKLDKVWTVTWTSIYGGIEVLSLKLAKALNIDSEVKRLEKNLDELAKKNGAAAENLDFGLSGDAMKQMQSFFAGFRNGAKEAEDAAAKARKAVEDTGTAANEAGGNVGALTDELRRLFDETVKKSKEALKASKDAGLDEIDAFKMKRDLAIMEVKATEDKIRAAKAMTPVMQKQLELAKDQYVQAAKNEIAGKLAKDAKEALKQANEQRAASITQGMTEIAQARDKAALAIAEIDKLEERAKKENKLTDALAAQYAEIRATYKAVADNNVWKIQQEAIKEAIEANQNLGFEIARVGLEGEELFDLQLVQALQQIDLAEERARKEGKLTDELKAQLDAQRMLTKEKAKGEKDARNPIMEQVAAVTAAIAAGAAIAADLFKDAMSGGPVDRIATVFDDMGSWPEKVMAAFSKLDQVLVKIINSMPAVVEKLVAALPGLLAKIVEAIPKAMATIGAMLPKIAKALADAAPQLIAAIMEGLPAIIEGVTQAIEIVLEKLPDILSAFLERVPMVLTKLLTDALPRIFAAIFKAIPGVIESILEHLPEIAGALVEGFIDGVGKIVAAFIDEFIFSGGAERIVGSLLRAIPRVIGAILAGIWKGVVKFVQSLGAVFGRTFKLPKEMAQLPQKIADAGKTLAKNIARDSSQLFNVKDLTEEFKRLDLANKMKEYEEQFMALAQKAGKSIWDWFVQAWRDAVDWFGARGAEIWHGLLEAIGDIVAWFKDKGAMIWHGFLDAIGDVAAWMKARGGEIWDGFLKPVGQWFADRGTAIWNGFIKPIGNFFGDMGTAIWNGFIKPVGTWFADAGKKIWDGLGIATQAIRDCFYRVGMDIWNGLGVATQKIRDMFFRVGADIWNGLKDGLSNFDWGSLIKLPTGGGGGGGGVTLDPRTWSFAGGMVTAGHAAAGEFISWAPKGMDRVPRMLAEGEFVVNRLGTARNLPALKAMNTGAKIGGGSPAAVVIENITITAAGGMTAQQIDREIVPAIERAIKRKSLDGGFVIAAAGVRKGK